MISTLGFACAIGSRLFAGLFLDKFGPKITSVLAGLFSSVGFILLATAEDTERLSQVIQPAWIILALGGAAIHLTSFHTTNLQTNKALKGQASVYISAGFGAGSLVLPLLQLLNQYGHVSLQAISAGYAAVTLLLTINCFFHQPWRAWNAIGSQVAVDLNCLRRSWWPESLDRLTAIKRPSDPKFPPLSQVLRSFQFWGECFWFSGNVFLLTYYLSTISQLLFNLGDAKVNDDVDSFANNIFTRVAIFFNGFGFIWAPTVSYLQKSKSIYFRVCLEVSLAFMSCVLLTIPIIELQIVVFILQAFVRLQIFSYHFAYLVERFGFRHFGLLNGISSLVAGLFGLCGYGLQIFTIFKAEGSFMISYCIVAALVLSTLVFPFVLRRLDRKAEEEKTTNEKYEDSPTLLAHSVRSVINTS
jgi:MFS family permease